MAKPTKTKPETEKPAKKPRAAKAPKADPKTPAPQVAGANSVDRDMQNLARVHRDKYVQLRAAQLKASAAMKNLGKTIKADGLTLRQIKLMVELSTPEGEAAFKSLVANDLLAAQWQGAAIGAQLQLFIEPDRTPAVDIAYEQGIQDAMDAKSAISPYDPSVPQHTEYLRGYSDEQERRMRKGFKQLEPEAEDDRPTLIKAARDENDEFFDSASTKH